jgi:hypothetical protein
VSPFPIAALTLVTLFFAAAGPAPAAPAAPVHTCRWSFPGGTPAASTSCTPPPVRYATPGPKPVTLTVCSPSGRCTTVKKQLTVLDPRPAVARIEAEPAAPYVGDPLHLSAKVSGKPPLSWLWTLPGGATASGLQAVVPTARLAPGLLTVKLRLSNRSGTANRTLYLRLQDPKPVISALSLSSTTPTTGSLLRATPTVSGRPPLAFLWTLDGQALSTASPLAWEVSGVAAGAHTLALRVGNAAGFATLARTITVQQPLIRDFRPVCPNLLCLFSISTAVAFELALDPAAHPLRYDYDWSGNGTFTESSPAPVPIHVYTEPGNYRLRVRVTTAFGSEVRLASQFLLVTR